ncbi:hypothetical protein RclHR1_04440008 [Rhizophagus clarus]|uniref:DUF676 domain-containing protein n=1 Tax=Rhizophagus clarus TaxID=94130 RepID=A0A2Z6RH52_9GLOM|nr:hypothetical protein RclHR1_04440008 [Rhizophagus clarus]
MSTNPAKLVKLWKAKSELTVGEITKYRIYFDPRKIRNSTAWPPNNLVLKVTNTTPLIFRAAILMGPYNISATCFETNSCITIPKQQTELIVPQVKAGIKCGETWKISLSIPKEREEWSGDWTIEILSDIVFTSNRVQYEISLFSIMDEDEIKISNIKNNTYKDDFTLIEIFSPTITYEYFKPKDVFYLPDLTTINNVNREIESIQDTKRSVHLIVLTHGIHGSMLDELYLREVIEEKCKHKLEHKVVVYMSDVNHSVTEDGIEKCGRRLAESILKYIGWPWISSNSLSSSASKNITEGPLISKISFVGHSLGGLINIFLVGYLNSVTNGIFFKDVEPVHYIAIASPLLGSTDLAWYIKIGMKWGAIGQTGKDLALIPRSKVEHSASDGMKEQVSLIVDSSNEEPLLLSLSRPNSSAHIALKLFKNRTLYANISNDATVSLRTSSLFFINHNDEDFIKDQYNATIFDHLKHLLNAINPPETTKEYLIRSFSDKSPILHDKLYTPNDIPPITNTENTSNEEEDEDLKNLPIEEQIARLWHKDMTWVFTV